MSKVVTIPKDRNPFIVIVNGVEHKYPAGATIEVPDSVADVIYKYEGAKPKPDPNHAPGGNSGSSVQSDWNQNDSSAADFIKNKPFRDVSIVILEEQELPYDAEMACCMGMVSAPIAVGDYITVVFDGAPYVCEAIDAFGNVAFGNLGLLGGGDDTGEPFIGMYMAGAVMFACTDEANHTFKISLASAEKLPAKYYDAQAVFYIKTSMPNNYLYTDSECTIKATKMDVASAACKMPIVVFLGTTYFLHAVTVNTEGDYAKVYCGIPTMDGALGFGAMVTAEYTPPTT